MQREPRDHIRNVYPIFFWQECEECKNEFKREKMWGITYTILTSYHHHYLCTHCAPTRSEARILFKSRVGPLANYA